MRKTLSLLALSTTFSVLALAGNFSGKLLDANCYDQQKKAGGCMATTATTAFALEASGKVYKFDSAGNSKAAAALKNRADRAADPAKPQPAEVNATVTGKESGDTITVEAIEVQ